MIRFQVGLCTVCQKKWHRRSNSKKGMKMRIVVAQQPATKNTGEHMLQCLRPGHRLLLSFLSCNLNTGGINKVKPKRISNPVVETKIQHKYNITDFQLAYTFRCLLALAKAFYAKKIRYNKKPEQIDMVKSFNFDDGCNT